MASYDVASNIWQALWWGVYDHRRSKTKDRALRAAPVDTETGELIDDLITIPLEVGGDP
jgi:hypothetical protein